MTREELLGSLTDLKEYYVIPGDAREKLNMPKGRHFSVNYSPENDPRLGDLFDYRDSNSKGLDAFMLHAAFAIVASLETYYIHVPTSQQMTRMLDISGYSAAQMKEYIWRRDTPTIASVMVKSKATTVYLLTRVMTDALTDRDGWKAYKKGKKRKNIPAPDNKSMQKFKTLVDYMQAEHLLTFGESAAAECKAYKDFVVGHAKPVCIECMASNELKDLSSAADKRYQLIKKDIDREMERLARVQVRQQLSKPNVPKLPLANPNAATNVIAQDYRKALNSERGQLDLMMGAEVPGSNERIGKAYKEIEEIKQICESCSRRADDLSEKGEQLYDLRVQIEYIPEIAVGAFLAVLEGDDIFKLKIGDIIIGDFFDQTNLPCFGLNGVELEDEEEWNNAYPELNGKLALPIVEEDDLISFPRQKDDYDDTMYISLGAVISRLAKRTFEPRIYIRKSIVKLFKKCGYSDRKARDYAIVIAVLNSVMRNEVEDYHVMSKYPENQASDTTALSTEEIIDQRIADERQAREQAEQDLKQSQRENQLCRHEISKLQKEIAALQKELDSKNLGGSNDNSAGDDVTSDDSGSIPAIEFPYHTNLRVVLYGGFDIFHQELQKYLPDVRIIPVSAHIDVAPVRNADIVFLQTNKTGHSNYWTVRDACKNSDVPCYHLNYASAKRCAEFMVGEISKLENTN